MLLKLDFLEVKYLIYSYREYIYITYRLYLKSPTSGLFSLRFCNIYTKKTLKRILFFFEQTLKRILFGGFTPDIVNC